MNSHSKLSLWLRALLTLRERFREDRLGITAGSLTFTTSIALVPFFTVALAIFTAFPMFAKLQVALQSWLVDSLIPDDIARQVMGYLTMFSKKANKLGIAGLAVLLVTAIALVLTIDRTLNNIWRVKKPRPLAQRVLIYWAVITLGPLLLGASLASSSYLVLASKGVVGTRWLFGGLEFALFAAGVATLYRYVPNTHVRWSHAWAGGLFVALGIELSKKMLTLYLSSVPTYSAVYGAFATLPILLVWIYVAWLVVLLGAVIAAYWPYLVQGATQPPQGQGWPFSLALQALQELHLAKASLQHGLNFEQLLQRLNTSEQSLEPVLETLVALDWIAQLNDDQLPARYVLLAPPEQTLLEPLVKALLLEKTDAVQALWERSRWSTLTLNDVFAGLGRSDETQA